MDTLDFNTDVSRRLAADIRAMPDARDELARILEAEGMTDVLDLLAGLAEERSQIEGDRWEQIGQLVQKCATRVEHDTRELV